MWLCGKSLVSESEGPGFKACSIVAVAVVSLTNHLTLLDLNPHICKMGIASLTSSTGFDKESIYKMPHTLKAPLKGAFPHPLLPSPPTQIQKMVTVNKKARGHHWQN